MRENDRKIAQNITNPTHIKTVLAQAQSNSQDASLVQAILDKAATYQGLNQTETATLLFVDNPEQVAALKKLASEVKEHIYGNRVVLFAPLYVSNYCVNGCTYCGYKLENQEMPRIKLTMEQIIEETRAMINLGHKRIALESGEDPVRLPIDYMLEAIRTIYSVKENGLSLRRINVNIAAESVENYTALYEAEIGTYILFQESYDEETYRKYHPTGPKSNFAYHTSSMHRAMEGGIEDVGFGALFGLTDWRYEVVGLLNHAEILEKDRGVGPHTISLPRIKAAPGVTQTYPHAMTDEQFLRAAAVLRLALPYVGLIVSTRETKELRDEALKLGISQMSAASNTGVGGYSVYANDPSKKSPQFSLSDERTTTEVVHDLCASGHTPSFCTACYRQGRTGDRFMELAKSGAIGKVCAPNALLTLKEFFVDFAPGQEDEAFFTQELNKLEPAQQVLVLEKFAEMKQGKRDIFF